MACSKLEASGTLQPLGFLPRFTLLSGPQIPGGETEKHFIKGRQEALSASFRRKAAQWGFWSWGRGHKGLPTKGNGMWKGRPRRCAE